MLNDLTVGGDGLARCPWGDSPPEYRAYHDFEWGRPVGDDDRIFEKLSLEGFQAGLSWLTILRKRDAFREVFAGFDPAVVARFDAPDVERLLGDPRVVRHRGKIDATIANARATLALRSQGLSLAGLVWQYRSDAQVALAHRTEIPPSTPAARALSAELRRRGFRFVGPTTVYAAMQSLGVVNDHLVGCAWREAAELERARFSVPLLQIPPRKGDEAAAESASPGGPRSWRSSTRPSRPSNARSGTPSGDLAG
ncbi:MAG: DNA-3-methyladenine glycosylase I [Acidimicrobiales bacterium]